ncbi:hypothetical protein Leryth_004482 [Lithospermum erythrorhizon]|nr:hypothetical protein Leryth_004482 [Lithospermum erythrorhizon]
MNRLFLLLYLMSCLIRRIGNREEADLVWGDEKTGETSYNVRELGLADDSSSSSSKNETKHSYRSSIITKALIGCLGVAIVAFSILLFKIWRRKKREEQQARLLKLFEDDDELEVELGIRD